MPPSVSDTTATSSRSDGAGAAAVGTVGATGWRAHSERGRARVDPRLVPRHEFIIRGDRDSIDRDNARAQRHTAALRLRARDDAHHLEVAESIFMRAAQTG